MEVVTNEKCGMIWGWQHHSWGWGGHSKKERDMGKGSEWRMIIGRKGEQHDATVFREISHEATSAMNMGVGSPGTCP